MCKGPEKRNMLSIVAEQKEESTNWNMGTKRRLRRKILSNNLARIMWGFVGPNKDLNFTLSREMTQFYLFATMWQIHSGWKGKR